MEKLTETAIARFAAPDPSGKQTIHWDDELKGFGVLCSGVSTSKAYIVQKKLADRKTRRVTIAPVAAIPLENVLDNDKKVIAEGARTKAKRIILQFGEGKDPKAEKRAAARAAVTLRQTLEEYLSKQPLAAASARLYRLAVETYLADWADRSMRAIDADMVEDRRPRAGPDRDVAAKIALCPGGPSGIPTRAPGRFARSVQDEADARRKLRGCLKKPRPRATTLSASFLSR